MSFVGKELRSLLWEIQSLFVENGFRKWSKAVSSSISTQQYFLHSIKLHRMIDLYRKDMHDFLETSAAINFREIGKNVKKRPISQCLAKFVFKSWIRIHIRITSNIEIVRDIPDSHVPVNFRNDSIKIATAREVTDRQTDKQMTPIDILAKVYQHQCI